MPGNVESPDPGAKDPIDDDAGGTRSTAKARSGFIVVQSDETLTPRDHAVLGSLSKTSAKFVLYPLDTWKSRCQARRFGDLSEFRGLWTLRGVYRGFATKCVLYAPYQAVYMAVYVRVRGALTGALPADGGGGVLLAPLACGVAGVIAEVGASFIRLPMEVTKLRLQLGVYPDLWHACRDVARRPGLVYGNFKAQTLMHDCAYSSVSWLTFEGLRQRIFLHRDATRLPTYENLALGTLAGATAAVLTNPLDVLKTRVVGNSHRVEGGSGHPSLRSVALAVLRQEGPRALWRGVALRVLHIAPAHGLYFVLYEASKEKLAAWRQRGIETPSRLVTASDY